MKLGKWTGFLTIRLFSVVAFVVLLAGLSACSGTIDPRTAKRCVFSCTEEAQQSLENGAAAYDRGDYAAALEIFGSLAEQDNARAQHNIGLMYDLGHGVKQDYGEALKWYHRAVEEGDPWPPAQHNLGLMYSNGRGVPPDYGEAAKWWHKAAENGHPFSQHNLGNLYLRGQGVAQDHLEAAFWYRRAAEQGLAQAQFSVGHMYKHNLITTTGYIWRTGPEGQDYGEAAKWYRRAAQQGHAAAQLNLGLMYEAGLGVEQSYVEAEKCYILAAAALPPGEDRDLAVKNRYTVAGKMTPAEVTKARRLVRGWKAKSTEPRSR